jgi:hypothetical protein
MPEDTIILSWGFEHITFQTGFFPFWEGGRTSGIRSLKTRYNLVS